VEAIIEKVKVKNERAKKEERESRDIDERE